MSRTTAWMCVGVVVCCSACSRAEPGAGRVRPPYFAQHGWYPNHRDELRKTADRMLAEAEPARPDGRLVALISPHAGFRFSGGVAAHGYRLVDAKRFDRVLLIGVAHRAPLRGASIPDVDAYRTPLGDVPLDLAACEQLRRHPLFSSVPAVHRREHSLEIQLPFLQRRLKSFRLIPIAVGSVDDRDCEQMARALKPVVTSRTLVVVSSDFTHFGADFGYQPFTSDIEANLGKLDRRAFDLIVKRDTAGFDAFLTETRDTICGRNGIKVLLRLLPTESRGTLLKYDTSGRMLKDWGSSVSYASISFHVPDFSEPVAAESAEPTAPVAATARLTQAEKQALLKLARASLALWVREHAEPDLKKLGITLTRELKAKRGAFVTLKVGGQLRGCIGYIEPREALYRTVMENAKNASTRDWRFRPVDARELAGIEIEISALTVPIEIRSPDEFVVGRHGIILRKGRRGAVYLPQVAPEQGWDRSTTLGHLCRKAGLPVDAWRKPGMRFRVFEAEVFHEQGAAAGKGRGAP